MARVVMLASVVMRWSDAPGGTVMSRCPAIGEEIDIPEDVLKNLKREYYNRVSKARGAAQSADGPEPHLARRIK